MGRSCSLVVVDRLLIGVASLIAEHGWALVVAAPRLWGTGSIVVAHGLTCSMACESSQTRDQTRVSCTGRKILYHWATRDSSGLTCDLCNSCLLHIELLACCSSSCHLVHSLSYEVSPKSYIKMIHVLVEKDPCLIHLWNPLLLTESVTCGGRCLVSILCTELWKPMLQHLLGWLINHVHCLWPCSLTYEQQKSWLISYLYWTPLESQAVCWSLYRHWCPLSCQTTLAVLVLMFSKWDN